MTFRSLFFYIILIFLPFFAFPQNRVLYNVVDSAVEKRVYKDIAILASDSFKGREAGTLGEIYAREYIKARFIEIGLSAAGVRESFFQALAIKNYFGGETYSDSAYNVLGFVDNNASRTVVIGAHYDHVGMGGFGSRDKNAEMVHNGADDNASGTAVMLELARQLSQTQGLNSNFLFIAFSAEEKGLLGSYYFTGSSLFKKYNISYYINLDMVGRLGIIGQKLIVMGTGTSASWGKVLKRTDKYDLKLKKFKAAPGFSDHQPFYEKQVPYIYFTTGLHPDYHTASDDTHRINISGVRRIVQICVSFIKQADKEDNIEFKKTKGIQSLKTMLFFAKML